MIKRNCNLPAPKALPIRLAPNTNLQKSRRLV